MKSKQECKLSNRGAIFNEIKRLHNDGTLPRLVSVGLLSPKALTYMNIAERVDTQQQRMRRTTSANIIHNVANEFKVSTATVYRAVKVMKTPLLKCDKNNK